MAGSSLEDLPPELLLEICEYLDAIHRPSLKSLSLSKKVFLNPCSSILFRKIYFHAASPEVSVLAAKIWTELLSQRHCLDNVRTVEIDGFMASDEEQAEYRDCQYCQGVFGDSIYELGLHDHGHAMSLHDEDKAFEPISTFATELPYASDVVWSCHNVVPQCILTATRDIRPSLRLHVNTFKLFHLNSSEIGVRELQILQSPSLYSLKAHYVASEMNGVWSEHHPKQVITKLMAGLAPNLRHLETLGCSNKILRPYHQSPLVSIHTVDQRTGDLSPAKLETLRLFPGTVLDEEDLPIWYKRLDPTQLRCLQLGSALSTPLIEWLSTSARFEGLQELTFAFDNPQFSEPNREARSNRAENIRGWITGLPPLKVLDLSGPLYPEYATMIEAALQQHGATLRKLVIRPPLYTTRFNDSTWSTLEFDVDMLATMAKTCPILEELSIPLRRRQSSSFEVQLYKALAPFPKLTKLTLDLECGCWALDAVAQDQGQDISDEDREPWSDFAVGTRFTNGRVRRALINAAFDQSLAKQIWDVISSNKHGRALQSLKVGTVNSAFVGYIEGRRRSWDTRRRFLDLSAIFQKLESSHTVSRSDSGGLVVQEIDRVQQDWDVCHPNGSEMKLFRSIWPETIENSDWEGDWHSMPLVVSPRE